MKKAKKVLSVLLTMCMVLSTAVFVASATPAELTVVDGNKVFVDFEDGNLAGFTASHGTIALSDGTTEPAYSGTNSLKISMHTDGWSKVKVEPEKIPGSDFGFEKGKTYYISFWLKSDSTKLYHWQVIPGGGGANVGIPPYNGSNMNFNYNCTSGTALKDAGWIKGWTTYTVDGTGTQTFWQFVAALNAGDTIYLDNIEIAEVDGTTKTNSVPDSATAVTTGTNGAEMAGTGNFGKKVIEKASSTVTQDFTVFHYGEASWKIEHTTADSNSYFNMNNLSTAVPVDNAPYYYSFYAMSPEEGTKVQLAARKGWRAITEEVELVPNVWTKISGLYTHQADEIDDAYRHLNVLFVKNTDGTPIAYIDDIVAAKLSAEPEAILPVLTQTSIDYDYNGNATVVFTSSEEIQSLNGAYLAGADTMTLGADGKTITMTATGLVTGQDQEVSIAGATDIYGRSMNPIITMIDVPTIEEGPMEFVTTSIADNSKVLLVKDLYFTVPYAINEATLTTDKFSIEGEGARVSSVALYEGDATNKTVKVTLDGVLPSQSYTLSVDGVENTAGGKLSDSLSFSTETIHEITENFENGSALAEDHGHITVDGVAGSIDYAATDKPHNGSYSAKIMPTTWNGTWDVAGFFVRGLNIQEGKRYRVSYWYYSDCWQYGNGFQLYVDPADEVITATGYGKGNWNKMTIEFTANAQHAAQGCLRMAFFLSTNASQSETPTWIDDVKVESLDSTRNIVVYQPNIFCDGVATNAITDGDVTVKLNIRGSVADASFMACIAQYDSDNRMINLAPIVYDEVAVGADKAITLNLTNCENVKTKIIIMDSTTYAPLCEAIQFN